MKKYIIIIFAFLISIFILFLYEYMFHMPRVILLPKKYHLERQKSINLYTHKFTIYKINNSVSLEELKNFPSSWELERQGYLCYKWNKYNPAIDDIVPFIKSLINDCTSCEGKEMVMNFLKDLQDKKSHFLYSQIGLKIFNKYEIDASYFYFINEDTNTLYAFEILPHM